MSSTLVTTGGRQRRLRRGAVRGCASRGTCLLYTSTADEAGRVSTHILLTVAGCPLREKITTDVTAALMGVEGVTAVDVQLGVMTDEQRARLKETIRGGVAEREIPFAKPDSLTRVYACLLYTSRCV